MEVNKKFVLIVTVISITLSGVASDSPSWLVFTRNELFKSNNTRPIIIRDLSNPTEDEVTIYVHGYPQSLSYDIEQGKIYWSIRGSDATKPTGIQAANLDGSNITTLVTKIEGTSVLTGIALDWISKNIYYADGRKKEIGLCEPTGKKCAVLVHDPKNQPFRITLDPQNGMMYWTTRGEVPGIFKGGMDGSSPMRISNEGNGVTLPGGITLDHEAGRLYWVDAEHETIWTSNLEGQDVHPVETLGQTTLQAWHCAVGSDKIFWVHADAQTIKYCNKKDGTGSGIIENSRVGNAAVLFDMEIIQSGGQLMTRSNPCAGNPCADICVLTKTGHKCVCPEGLSSVRGQCEDAGAKVVITSKNGTYLLSLATLKMEVISSDPSHGVSFDYARGQIYWAAGENGSTIYRSSLNGSGMAPLVKIDGEKPVTGIAYDWIGENIYYTNGDHVGACARNGENCTVLLKDPRNPPLRIALDPKLGLMFWTTNGRIPSITRGGMDVARPKRIIRGISFKNGFVVDHNESRLFWLHRSDTIETSDFDWRNRRTIRPIRNKLISVAVMDDFLYWTDNETIQSCNKRTETDLKTVKKYGLENFLVWEMALIHGGAQPKDRTNHCAGSLCSHLCLLTENYFKCICQPEMELSPDGLTCQSLNNSSRLPPMGKAGRVKLPTLPASVVDKCGLNWTCDNGACIRTSMVCNGRRDCADGSDEGTGCDTPCSGAKCSYGCHNSPRGPRCTCPLGFKIAADRVSCEDIDECKQAPPICENYCINTNGSYQCNDFSQGRGNVAVAAAVPTVVTLLVLAIAIFVGYKYLQARKILRSLTPEEIQEFLEGNESAAKKADYGADKAMLMPFRLILAPEHINIARDAILGSGNFGIVYRGFYKSEAVAVKTFKRTVEIDEFKAVLAEAKIMAYLGRHAHVVEFIGADVSRISDRKIVLVTELSPHGDLLGYLRKINPSHWHPENGGCTPDGVAPNTLLSWCEQIAAGMEHLEAKKIIHGDLAARNVLVFKDNVVKITDFGLSKQLYGDAEYFIKRQRMLPWKWAALELLTRREFSTDSDIWAFGVTAWEIFSLGRAPFEELDIGLEFIQHLEQGHRLRKPEFASRGIYELLLECWNTDRSLRPRFAILREFFREESKNFGITDRDAIEEVAKGRQRYANV